MPRPEFQTVGNGNGDGDWNGKWQTERLQLRQVVHFRVHKGHLVN